MSIENHRHRMIRCGSAWIFLPWRDSHWGWRTGRWVSSGARGRGWIWVKILKIGPPGLGFSRRNTGKLGIWQWGPGWGGVNRSWRTGRQRSSGVQGVGWIWVKMPKTELLGLGFWERNAGNLVFGYWCVYWGWLNQGWGGGGTRMGRTWKGVNLSENAETELSGLGFCERCVGVLYFGRGVSNLGSKKYLRGCTAV